MYWQSNHQAAGRMEILQGIEEKGTSKICSENKKKLSRMTELGAQHVITEQISGKT